MQVVKFHVRRTHLEQAAASPTRIRERGTACLYSNTSFVFPKKNRHKNRRPVSRENRARGRAGSRSSPTTAAFRSPVESGPCSALIERTRFFLRRRLITPC